MGHYKTMLECIRRGANTIPNLVITIAYIALSTATPLNRWQRASQVMLEKGKGRYIENLRIIQLCEAELNFILHTIWGNRLIRHAMKHKVLDKAQYASPGHTCNNAVLNKKLFHGLLRQSLSPGILTDYDTTAAFDRFLTGLSIVTCQHIGLPRISWTFMFNLLKEMSFHLVTSFGKSSNSFYNNENNITRQGVLQGSSSAGPLSC
jgi:hypothetical protein